ncbi:MAG: murein biosynthesis integral membrane protein MurJ [Clostridia bacterium]
MNETSRMIKNTLIVFVFAIVAKGLSLIRESVVAAYAGTSLEADAYYMVTSIYTIFELGLSTSIYQSFFPIYKELSLNHKDEKKTSIFANSVITILCSVAILFVFLEIFGSRLIVGFLAPGFSSQGLELAQRLLIVSAPMLPVVVMAECFSTILRSHNIFSWSQARELGTHIGAILCIFILFNRLGIYAMGIGMLIGAIARMLIQMPVIRHIHSFKTGIQLKSNEIKKMLYRIPAALITASITEIKNIVDKMMASMLATGTVATLNYGYRLESAISGLIFNSIATGIYPDMVRLYMDQKHNELSKLIENCMQMILVIIIPLEIAAFFFGNELVTVVYKRGAFGNEEVNLTAMVFAAYMLGAVFFGLSLILSNIFYSAGDTQTPMKVNCVDLGLNIVFNFIFIKVIGAVGLALATSLASLISFFIRIKAVRKYVKLDIKNLLREFIKIISASGISGIISHFILQFGGVENTVYYLIMATIIMCLIYCALLLTFKSKSISNIFHWIEAKLKK